MINRYSLPEMTNIWEDKFKFDTWLQIEILACEARAERGEISSSDLEQIKLKSKFDIERITQIEKQTKHDVIAFLSNLEENIGEASRHIHYGMTSSDIVDTALCFQMKKSAELILNQLYEFREILKQRALEHKNTICIGRTHGIHAEPTTMGLKFLLWFEETNRNIDRLKLAIEQINVGKISGAVGTFAHLSPEIEKYVCEKMGMNIEPVSTQIIQRDRHAFMLTTMSVIASTLEKIATEIRHLQKTEVREVEEFFSEGQKGSSAMPHKRNPIISERICGLVRLIRSYSIAALENVPLWHERDISHSSVERIVIPDCFITLNYILDLSINLVKNLIIYPENMLVNINNTRGLIFSQSVLLKFIGKGIERQKAYEIIQDSAMKVWNNKQTDFKSELLKSSIVKNYFTDEEINDVFNFNNMLKNINFIFERTIR